MRQKYIKRKLVIGMLQKNRGCHISIDTINLPPDATLVMDSSVVCARLCKIEPRITSNDRLLKVAAQILPEYSKRSKHLLFGEKIRLSVADAAVVFSGVENVPKRAILCVRGFKGKTIGKRIGFGHKCGLG